MNVEKLRGNVAVGRGRRHEEPCLGRARDLQVTLERSDLEHQHVGALAQQRIGRRASEVARSFALVHRPVGDDRVHARARRKVGAIHALRHLHPFEEAGNGSAEGRYGVGGIVRPALRRAGLVTRRRLRREAATGAKEPGAARASGHCTSLQRWTPERRWHPFSAHRHSWRADRPASILRPGWFPSCACARTCMKSIVNLLTDIHHQTVG